MRKEKEEVRICLAVKGAEILHLKMKNQQLSSDGLCVVEALRVENA